MSLAAADTVMTFIGAEALVKLLAKGGAKVAVMAYRSGGAATFKFMMEETVATGKSIWVSTKGFASDISEEFGKILAPKFKGKPGASELSKEIHLLDVPKAEGAVKLSPDAFGKLDAVLKKGDIDEIIHSFEDLAGWKIEKSVFDKIPKEFLDKGIRLTDKSDKIPGMRLSMKKSDHIRIMKGDLNALHLTSANDYVKIVSNGKTGFRDGKFVDSGQVADPSYHPDAHIPLEEWLKWRKWNEK